LDLPEWHALGTKSEEDPVFGLSGIQIFQTVAEARVWLKSIFATEPPKLTEHQHKEAILRRDKGEESLADIDRSYNVSGWTIGRLAS
jgi:hypothetical protein